MQGRSLDFRTSSFLGNLDSRRDWGHAKDYVEAQWLMLQQDTPDDYVIATGEQHSVREFVEAAFRKSGSQSDGKGKVFSEKGYDDNTGKVLIEIDPKYFRPTEVETLLGDPSKAAEKLGWKAKIGFNEFVAEMVREDVKEAERDLLCKNGGFKIFSYHE